MALIEIYHVVADMYDVDPHYTGTIIPGQAVTLNANGYIEPTDAGDSIIGVAGDAISTEGEGAYSADVTVNGAGAVRKTENRVSDGGNETLASGLMTVYTSGGKFQSDQYDAAQAYVPGDQLYAGDAGVLTTEVGANSVVGTVVAGPAAVASGVPGADVNGSLSLGTFITFVLNIDNG